MFSVQDEKSKLEEELEFLRNEESAFKDTQSKSVQTNEFDDPFEQELFEEQS